MKNPFPVDTAYVISLAALARLCEILSDTYRHWWIDQISDTNVTVGYNNPTGMLPNELSFTFPVVAKLTFLGDQEGTMICLYPAAAQSGKTGLYFEKDKLCHDDMADWERFWFPIEAKLGTFSHVK